MGEITDLIGLYGQIDLAVQSDAESRARLARLFPAYADPDFHWYGDFVDWTIAKRGEDGPQEHPFPDVEEALADLAKIPPRGRMRARRILAIAAGLQGLPEMREGELRPLAADALVGKGLAPDTPAGDELVSLLADEAFLSNIHADDPATRDVWWDSVIDTAARQDLTPPRRELGPRPCVGRLVTVGVQPVAVLTAGFETDLLTFDQAIRFLDPTNWPACNAFWCEMTKQSGDPPGPVLYHEVVSTQCGSPLAWTVSADLDFTFQLLSPTQAAAVYQLHPPHPLPDDDVQVDQGTLMVVQNGDTISVTTTKRVRFNAPFSGEALAMIMCVLGYANICEDFVYTCGVEGAEGTDFPGGDAVAPKRDPGDAYKQLTDQVATAAKACIDDLATTVKRASDQVAAGTYTADQLVSDLTDTWVRMLKDGATALDLGVRSAQAASRLRDP